MKTIMKLGILLGPMLLSITTYAHREGGATGVGGGGDASESRVNEIRSDILNWINRGGSKGLILPAGITLNDYNTEMKRVLRPKNVVVTFIEQDDPTDEELRVQVDGRPKTCRGFLSKQTQELNMVCNIKRFKGTADSEQYRLIHHEYAGLAGLEKNDGAASDYQISNQLSEFLTYVSVLKLGIKKTANTPARNKCLLFLEVKVGIPMFLRKEANKSIIALKEKGYRVVEKFNKKEVLASEKFNGALLGTLTMANEPFNFYCKSSFSMHRNIDGLMVSEAFETNDNYGSEFGFFGGSTCKKTLQKSVKKIEVCK